MLGFLQSDQLGKNVSFVVQIISSKKPNPFFYTRFQAREEWDWADHHSS
jgi:hypothetical protein